MAQLPQIGHQRGSRHGIGLVIEIVHAPPERDGLGFMFRELPVVDGDLDGTIEVVGSDSECVSPRNSAKSRWTSG